MNSTIITLRAASAADEIHCADGEIMNSDQLFPTAGDDTLTSGESVTLALNPLVRLPEDADYLCACQPPGCESPLTVIRRADGFLAVGTGESAWSTLSPKPLPDIIKVVCVGCYLVVLTPSGVNYALFSDGAFRWLGESPSAPSPSFSASPRALPPYSYTPGENPVLSVAVGIGSDSPREVLDWLAGSSVSCSAATRQAVLEAVRAELRAFLATVKANAMHLLPVDVAVSWLLSDGTHWQLSALRTVSLSGEAPSLRILDASCPADTLHLSLQFSLRPFRPETDLGDITVPAGWEGMISDVKVHVMSPSSINADTLSAPVWLTATGRGFMLSVTTLPVSLPDVAGSLASLGVPQDIYSMGQRLLSLYSSEGRAATRVVTSAMGFPPVVTGEGTVAGRIFSICRSLQTQSVAAADFPLYAFCSDGVRTLACSGGAYRETRLLSRDVALGSDVFAPLPDATLFLTAAGLIRVQAATVRLLVPASEIGVTAATRMLYLYRENLVVLYVPGEESARVYDPASGEWFETLFRIDGHHYLWPRALAVAGDAVGELAVQREPASSAGGGETDGEDGAGGSPIPFTTRSLKFGSPFTVKQAEFVEAIWPDGSQLPLKVYGAMRLDKWYFLGLAPRGRMRMRGSGWRFFRVESFATPSCLLPAIRFTF